MAAYTGFGQVPASQNGGVAGALSLDQGATTGTGQLALLDDPALIRSVSLPPAAHSAGTSRTRRLSPGAELSIVALLRGPQPIGTLLGFAPLAAKVVDAEEAAQALLGELYGLGLSLCCSLLSVDGHQETQVFQLTAKDERIVRRHLRRWSREHE